MKKIITSVTTLSLIIITILSTSGFVRKSQSGIAGYTGSPGEATCNAPGCHGGGSSASSGIVISAVPAFVNDEYVPGTTYVITIDVSAAGFSRFGFGCEILNPSNTNAGTMQGAGAGVKFLNSGARKNAVHTTPKVNAGTASFSFQWVAPAANDAKIYVAGNAVNGNGSTSGDFPIPPVSLVLTAKAPEPEPVGVNENNPSALNGVSVFPNPTNGLSAINYQLTQTQNVAIQLVNINGKLVKEFFNDTEAAGPHNHILDLHNIAAGVYFVKTLVNNEKVSQKLIAVQ